MVCKTYAVFVGCLLSAGAIGCTRDAAPARVAAPEQASPPLRFPLRCRVLFPFRFRPCRSSRNGSWIQKIPRLSSSVGTCSARCAGCCRSRRAPSPDEANPANSKITATVDVRTITTGVEERDAHLKSPDFFDVAKYPAITFASTAVSRSSATSYAVTGNLSMHGVTQSVTLAVTASPPFNHAGGIRRGIEATTSVNRKDFRTALQNSRARGQDRRGDTIQITINAELVLLPEPGKSG